MARPLPCHEDVHPTSPAILSLPTGISRAYLLRHRVCPWQRLDDGRLLIAVAPPFDPQAVADLAQWYQLDADTTEVSDRELDQRIERMATEADRVLEVAQGDEELLGEHELADARELANHPPVIRYVNLLLREAHDAAASDIHLEATRLGLVSRFRLDGVLAAAPAPPPRLHHAIVSRIKTLANLDIAERRRPQDGRVRARLVDREIDIRVSTVPTVHGESVVLRLLDGGGRPGGLTELGFPASINDAFSQAIAKPHGMILVTGPTGSGKTTTLYAALGRRDPSHEKIITVEDPVEYELPGITQVPVQRQTGVGFAAALRAILRQDPDVVLIGEMRDRETAEIAVQAAMTGHLVLSTLHTNTALGAIPRLRDIGIAEYLIASTLEGILAQRLVRRLCPACAAPGEADPRRVAALLGRPVGRVEVRVAVGCDACRRTGYRGRVGVFEYVPVGDDLRAAIARGATAGELETTVRNSGGRFMNEHGWTLIDAGLTTVDEVLRVLKH